MASSARSVSVLIRSSASMRASASVSSSLMTSGAGITTTGSENRSWPTTPPITQTTEVTSTTRNSVPFLMRS